MSKKIEAVCSGACLKSAHFVSADAQVPIQYSLGWFRFNLNCGQLEGKHCTAGARFNYTSEGLPVPDPRCPILDALADDQMDTTPFLRRS